MPSTAELLDLAIDAAHAAGALLRAEYARASRVATVSTKSSATDPVTAADHASEELIVARIDAARPHDGILAEEATTRDSGTGITWIVDPLDGTANFVFNRAAFAVSIAAADEAGSLVGVVYDPVLDETFRAARGGGAYLGARRLHLPEDAEPIASSLVGTGFAYLAHRRALQGALVAQILPHIRDIRRVGAAALDLCAIGSGRLDAYFEADLKPWDLAAGALVCTEAGARLEVLDGLVDVPTVVVAHPRAFEAFVTLLLGAREAAHERANPGQRGATS